MSENPPAHSPAAPPAIEFLGHASELEQRDGSEGMLSFWVSAFILAVLLCVGAVNLLGVGWIGNDQQRLDNDLRLRSSVGLAYTWRHPLTSPQLPLGETLLNLQYRAFGPNKPAAWHAITAFALAVTSLALLLFLRRSRLPRPTLVCAILVAHPLSLASAARLQAAPMFVSMLACLLAYLAYAQLSDPPPVDLDAIEVYWLRPLKRPSVHLAGLLLAAAIALLADTTTALVASVLFLYDIRRSNRHQPLSRRYTIGFAAYCITALTCAVLWRTFQSDPLTDALRGLSVAPKICCDGAWRSFVPTAVPFDPIATAPLSVTNCVAWIVWIAGGLLALRLDKSIGRAPQTVWLAMTIAAVFAAVRAERLDDELLISAPLLFPIVALISIALVASLIEGAKRGIAQNVLPVGSSPPWLGNAAVGLVLIVLLARTWFITAELNDEPAILAAATARSGSISLACAQGDALVHAASVEGSSAPLYRAQTVYADAISRHPRNRAARVGLAAVFAKLHDYDPAIAIYRQLIDESPNDPTLYTGESQLYAAKGVSPQALRLSERALELNPRDPIAQHDVGLQLDIAGRLDEAAIAYGRAMQLDPLFCAARVNLATLWFRQGKVTEASEMLLSATQIDPLNFDAYANAGAMLATLQQWPRAEQMLRAALSLKHDSRDVWKNLSIVLDAEGKTKEAEFARGRVAGLAN